MNRPTDQPERRKRNLRDPTMWERDLNGYAVCPWCAAMVYAPRADLHMQNCAAGQSGRRKEDNEGG